MKYIVEFESNPFVDRGERFDDLAQQKASIYTSALNIVYVALRCTSRTKASQNDILCSPGYSLDNDRGFKVTTKIGVNGTEPATEDNTRT